MRAKELFGKRLKIAFITAVVLITAAPGFAQAPKKVAVFPFAMNSPQDLGFLQNGLFSMLSSRLADPGKVEVLDRETIDKAAAEAASSELTKGDMTEAKARMVGANMGVDYILFGSLTHFGESVSLDANMVDVTGEKKTLSFFEQSNSMGDVIPLVNSFAGDINEKVFNRRINNELYAQPEPQEAPAPGAFQHAGGASVYGGGMMAMQAGKGFMTHLKFDDTITAMAVGDLKNDGVQRVVTATDYNLHVYRLKGTQLALEETLEYSSTNRIVGLDVADINNNGFPEIFVTSLTVHLDGLQSFVVEYTGKTYNTIMDGDSYYYRVVNIDMDRKLLMAQDKGSSPFDGRIYTMMPQGSVFEEEKRMRMPRNTSVLSLARGAVTAEGSDEYVMLNKYGRLVVADESGGQLWEGTSRYGGVANHWLMPRNDTDATYRDMVYLMPRVKLHDVNKDGVLDVIAVQNNEAGGGTFGRYKRYQDGYVQTLSWSGIGLAPTFQTTPVQGWISDFAIADLDGDGVQELIVSVVSRSKITLLAKDKGSNIISYSLE